MENKIFSPKDSLQTITDAARKARTEKGHAAYYLVLWGLLIALYAICFFIGLKLSGNIGMEIQSLSWIVFPVGGLLSYLHSRKTSLRETAKPLHDNLYRYVWSGIFLCLAILTIFGAQKSSLGQIIPIVILLFGLAAFITGGVTNFNHL
jgi:uncharacterized membrane protein YhaH (DUF805 family)